MFQDATQKELFAIHVVNLPTPFLQDHVIEEHVLHVEVQISAVIMMKKIKKKVIKSYNKGSFQQTILVRIFSWSRMSKLWTSIFLNQTIF